MHILPYEKNFNIPFVDCDWSVDRINLCIIIQFVRENVFFSLFFIKYQICEYWFNWRVNIGNGGEKKRSFVTVF